MTTTINNAITPEKFLEAWRAVWERDERESGKLAEIFQGQPWTPVTEYMLTSDNSFLRRVGGELGINEQPDGCISQDSGGILKLDMAFIADNKDGCPTFIDVMIEHENDRATVKNEMWKLMFLRSPLKVLVTYSATPEAENQPQKLLDMLNEANQDFPENENTTYLFIFGRLLDGKMSWQWCSNEEPTPKPLC